MRILRLLPVVLTLSALASEPVTFTGRVLIQNNGPRTVVAFIEPAGGRTISHVLRLTAEQPFPQNPISLQFEKAHVELFEDRYVITSAEQRLSVVFGVSRRAFVRAPDQNLVLLRGYWLSSRTMTPGHTLATVRRGAKIAAQFCDASYDSCEDDGGTGSTGVGANPSCDSGGRGSVSCSCTSGSSACSTTCGSGYYACCSNCYVVGGPTCKCVKY